MTLLTFSGHIMTDWSLSKITFNLDLLQKFPEKFWPNFQEIANLNLGSSGESKIMFNVQYYFQAKMSQIDPEWDWNNFSDCH